MWGTELGDLTLDGKRSQIRTPKLGWMPLPRELPRTVKDWMALRKSTDKTKAAHVKER
jgi:hypothetical protein